MQINLTLWLTDGETICKFSYDLRCLRSLQKSYYNLFIAAVIQR